MTLKYFKDQVHEELDGAKMYIEKAVEAKIEHPAWSRQFSTMADMEAEHAASLMKMMECFIRDMKKNGESTTTMDGTGVAVSPEDVYKNSMKEFGEVMTYVTNMKRGL